MKRKLIASLIIGLVVCFMLALSLTAGTFAHAAALPCVSVNSVEGTVTPSGCAYLTSSSTSVKAHFTNTFSWSIDKDVTPDFQDLSSATSGVSQYTIEVTKGATGALAASLDGCVNVANLGDTATQGLQVSVSFQSDVPVDADTVIQSNVVISSGVELAPISSQCFPYHFDIPLTFIANGADFDVVAIASALNSNTTGSTGEGALSLTPTLVHNSITVKDTFTGLTYGPLSDSTVAAQYNRTFTCPSASDVTNTATIIYDDGTVGPSDMADVHVICPKVSTPTPTPTQPPTPTTPGLPNTGSDPNA